MILKILVLCKELDILQNKNPKPVVGFTQLQVCVLIVCETESAALKLKLLLD